MTVAVAPAGVLLVGSVCCDTTEEVFQVISKELPNHVKYIPDGETGDRQFWISWQTNTFAHVPRLQRALDSGLEPESSPSIPLDDVAKLLGDLNTGYDKMALASYPVFAKLKSEGKIPSRIKFQVSVPTPLAAVVRGVDFAYAKPTEPVWEAALKRDLRRIQDEISHDQLAIQIDVANETAFLERAYADLDRLPLEHAAFGYTGPWFDDVNEGVYSRLSKVASKNFVDEDVEMGFHLCYGDQSHKHFKEPEDTSILANLIYEILTRTDRKVSWIHIPVPRNRTDAAYYKPLEKVADLLKKNGTTLYVGLVHGHDLEGTQARIEATSKVLKDVNWGVATECGIGRTPREELPSILEISRKVSTAVS
jgi:hypothetical protein